MLYRSIIRKLNRTNCEIVYSYGTAGFRTDAETVLNHIIQRVPTMLKIVLGTTNWVKMGVVITASHNPVKDNGIKFVGQNGEILEQKFEFILNTLVNMSQEQFNDIKRRVKTHKHIGFVVVGYDCRPSSGPIKNKLIDEAEECNIRMVDCGRTTTPQLHIKTVEPKFNYIKHFSDKFKTYTADIHVSNKIDLVVDCANGVGAIPMAGFKHTLKKHLNIDLINMRQFHRVNNGCGSEYVQKQLKLPLNYKPEYNGKLVASFDGDADRLVFFYTNKDDDMVLLDGDKIGVLITSYIKKCVDQAEIDANIGFVQTAYANSGSTNFIKDVLDVDQEYVPTGVKYLHKKAKEYDIGTYFESNGHGTIIFKKKFLLKVLSNIRSETDLNKAKPLMEIIRVYRLLNQMVGDSISTMLCVCYILLREDMSLEGWNNQYQTVPCKQFKIMGVTEEQKKKVTTSPDEMTVYKPKGLQKEIDQICSEYEGCRSFVRPSGTEPCIRVYVECADEIELDGIGKKIEEKVKLYL